MMLELLFYFALIIVALSTLISAFNLFTAPKFANRKNESTNEPFISVLIPARNEEKNIGNIIEDLTKQTYKNFELIILDDDSESYSSIRKKKGVVMAPFFKKESLVFIEKLQKHHIPFVFIDSEIKWTTNYSHNRFL